MNEKYVPGEIEPKWQKLWADSGAFHSEVDRTKPEYYVLEMFPYPSGALHMGHVRNYSIGDVVARFQKMRGYNVLHPMGWDAFGMPAENAAIKNKVHPADWTWSNIRNMRRQQQELGLSYDWDREVATCHPEYYRWTQWLFLLFFERGLAYKKKAAVNWCEECNTVLANEQVIDGNCWRCNSVVVKKELEQWKNPALLEQLSGQIYATESAGSQYGLRVCIPPSSQWTTLTNCPSLDPNKWDVQGSTCAFARGLSELPLIPGTAIGTLADLAAATLAADKVITF